MVFLAGGSGFACGGATIEGGPDPTARHWNPEDLSRSYELVEVDNVPGELPVYGVAYDGSYFWLVYVEEVGGFYDPDRITVARYDAANRKRLDSFVYDKDYIGASGLVLVGPTVWLNAGKGGMSASEPHSM